MRFEAYRSSVTRILAAVGIALVGAGCSDDPTDPGDDHGDPVAVELYDRDTGELLAASHEDHWDGEFPELTPGDELEVDAVFLDEDDNSLPLDDEFEVRADLAEGAPEGILEVEAHGDHLDFEALAEGETAVLILYWHGSHADWESPALSVQVVVSD